MDGKGRLVPVCTKLHMAFAAVYLQLGVQDLFFFMKAEHLSGVKPDSCVRG